MSTEFGTLFGEKYSDSYGKVVAKWTRKLETVNKINDDHRAEWGADLQEAMGEEVMKGLLTESIKQFKRLGLSLPSKETLERFAMIAARGALQTDTFDLLHRLHLSVNAVTAAAASPIELLKRAKQTVSQVFDMASDRFSAVLGRFFKQTGQIEGRRRWHTVGGNSRHAALDGQVREEGEFFTYNGQEVYGPRPPGGTPADWSNCSCYLTWEKS